MPHFLRVTSVIALGACLALPVLAQEQSADGNSSSDLSLGVPADGEIGSTYSAAEHGDWEQRCIKTEDGNDPCQLYQLLLDAQGNAVAEISMFGVNDGSPAVAGATVITPLETLLTEQLRMSIDGGAAKIYPFTFCSDIGCFARIGLTQDDLDGFKRGAAATLTIVPAAAPGETVVLNASLSGFTAGFAAVEEANAKLTTPAPSE